MPLALPALTLLTAALPPIAGDSFHGTLILRGVDGFERTPHRAVLEVWTAGLCGWTRWQVECKEGRFTLQLPDRVSWLDVGRISIDGCEAWCWYSCDSSCPDAPVDLVARCTEPSTVRVVDARDGSEIAPYTLVRGHPRRPPKRDAPDAWDTRHRRPFRVPLWATDLESDSELERGWIGPRTYWVCAEGKAWTSIEIDPAVGGTRTLALEPEARIAVTIDDERPPLLLVEVRRTPTEQYSHRVPICPCEATATVGRLGAGRWFVTAGIASSDGLLAGRYLAIEPVDVRAGETRDVRLRLRERPIDATGKELEASSRR